MKIAKITIAAGLLLSAAVVCSAADVVVLRGGARIDLKAPPVQQGNTLLLTRVDGTLLSVPASEVDSKATAAARSEPSARRPNPALVAPPETPAQVVRLSREGPKARVKITDADVSHDLAFGGASDEEKPGGAVSGGARLEIGDYTQQKAGANLLVKGTLRNAGGTQASNMRLSVSALDQKGESLGSAEASLSGGTLDAGQTTAFTASLPVGEKPVGSLRFAPRWVGAPPPAPAGEAAAGREQALSGGPAAAAAPSSKPPAPAVTPFGRGSLYAYPVSSAPSVAPADGKTGYIPNSSSPENQPKPPQ